MAKRFTDTDKYKKAFIRGLPGAYKLFWDYLYHDCNFAGIWHVDMEIAQVCVGRDMLIDKDRALELFNNDEIRVFELNNGKKWFIRPFIVFQYGTLVVSNKLHIGVMRCLESEGVSIPRLYPLQGVKETDKETDKNKDSEDKRGVGGEDQPKEIRDYTDIDLLEPIAGAIKLTGESTAEVVGYWRKMLVKIGPKAFRSCLHTLFGEIKAGEVNNPGAILALKLRKSGMEADSR